MNTLERENGNIFLKRVPIYETYGKNVNVGTKSKTLYFKVKKRTEETKRERERER